jgi:hypothetical protein
MPDNTDWPEGTVFHYEPGDGVMEVILPKGTEEIPNSLKRDLCTVVFREEEHGFKLLKNLGEEIL